MNPAPSVVPESPREIYLVLDDFGGNFGRVWRETSEANTTRETLIRDLIEGLYVNPVRIVAFNIGEGWCRDATTDVARQLAELCAEMDHASDYIADFVSEHARSEEECEPEAEHAKAKRP